MSKSQTPAHTGDGGSTGREGPATLKIGAVARLSGVSVHTLRKWEDRHGAVTPRRTEGGERVYTQTDLERLRVIKRLADAGMSLGEVARLPLEELTRVETQAVPDTAALHLAPPGQVRVAILGTAVANLLADSAAQPEALEVVACAPDLDLLAATLGDQQVDVLILECPALSHTEVATIQDVAARIGAPGTVVVYRFAARADLAAAQASGVALLRAPADREALMQTVVRLAHTGALLPTPGARPVYAYGADAEVRVPRLSRAVVARVARTAPRMRCECPHHLADIILSLRAFEEYSADCENRHPEDTALHHYLWRSAALARGLFEDAIERVADAEGISLAEDGE